MTTEDSVRLAIRSNDCDRTIKCGLCGKPYTPPIGLILTRGDTSSFVIVCEECGTKHDPALAAVIAAQQPAMTGADPDNKGVDRWGGCPVCHTYDQYVNVCKEHWFVCHTHRTRWSPCYNLFSSWHHETETDWRKNWEKIAAYAEVEPWHPPGTQPAAKPCRHPSGKAASDKATLLAHYAGKEPTEFLQVDGFPGIAQDDVLSPDTDGDSIMLGSTHELMSGAYAVRLLVTAGTKKTAVLRILRKIAGVVERELACHRCGELRLANWGEDGVIPF